MLTRGNILQHIEQIKLKENRINESLIMSWTIQHLECVYLIPYMLNSLLWVFRLKKISNNDIFCILNMCKSFLNYLKRLYRCTLTVVFTAKSQLEIHVSNWDQKFDSLKIPGFYAYSCRNQITFPLVEPPPNKVWFMLRWITFLSSSWSILLS